MTEQDGTMQIATADDIRACFRLLLGRNPNPEEWPGHSARAGEPLEGIVRSFLASRECQDRHLLDTPRAEDVSFASVNGKLVAARTSDIDVGKHVLSGSYEPHVTALFKRVLRPGMTAIDVGANCGYFTFLALSLVGERGQIWAIEPNPGNVRLLELARRRNNAENVTIIPAAIGAAFGAACVYAGHSNGEVGPLARDHRLENIAAQVTLDCLTRDTRVDFIKVDVEGYEGNALRGGRLLLRDQRPSLVVEFAPTALKDMKGSELLTMLISYGYRLGVILPNGDAPFLEKDAILDFFQESGVDHIDLFASQS